MLENMPHWRFRGQIEERLGRQSVAIHPDIHRTHNAKRGDK